MTDFLCTDKIESMAAEAEAYGQIRMGREV